MAANRSKKTIVARKAFERKYRTVVTIADMANITLSDVDEMDFIEVNAILDVMHGPIAMRAAAPHIKELYQAALDRQEFLVNDFRNRRS